LRVILKGISDFGVIFRIKSVIAGVPQYGQLDEKEYGVSIKDPPHFLQETSFSIILDFSSCKVETAS
jgi:hypothetical protein